jgi:hypothetical protein
VAQPSSILDGQVTYSAFQADWFEVSPGPEMGYLRGRVGDYMYILPNSLPPDDCDNSGGTPPSAEELVRAIRTDPDLEATAPVPARVGGIDALRLDVAVAPGAATCTRADTVYVAPTPYSEGWGWIQPGDLARLYVLDLPEPLRVPWGPPARTLTILIRIHASQGDFERTVASVAPILDSFEFHAK